MKRISLSTTIATAALLSVAHLAQAVPINIDFDADATGPQANGFQSAQAAGVGFFDTVGADLIVLPSGGGNALGVGVDQDGSALEIRFAFDVDLLSLAFGNDDPSNTNAGDLAVLTLFSGLTQVGQVTTQLNRDDLVNQTISFGALGSAVTFDRAIFAFTDPFLSLFTGGGATNVGASELVDNIFLNSVAHIVGVAEPGTILLLLAAVLAYLVVTPSGRRRRRDRSR